MGSEDQLIRSGGPRPRVSGCCASTKAWGQSVCSHAGLSVALVIYTAFGGLVFMSLEYPPEVARLEELDRMVRWERKELLASLVNTSSAEQELRLARYEEAVQEVAKGGLLVPMSQGVAPPSLARWSYLQAVFFASTVLTTIGYGNITPNTLEGRVFCIMFALVGIPLTVSVLADLGSLLACRLPDMPEARGLRRSLASAAAATSILLLYIAVGSLLFISWEEDWSFFDGFYFCFVTMTTIGFGDLVPSTPQYMLLCTVYIVIGLSLTSTIIEVVRQQYSQSWRHLQALAETLAHLAAERGTSDRDRDIQADLAKIATVIKITNCKKTKHWETAVKQLSDELHKQKDRPKIVQIIFYESSV